jgi:hypothetical protein
LVIIFYFLNLIQETSLGLKDFLTRKKKPAVIEVAGRLAGFALDPNDIQECVNELPRQVDVNRGSVEYELRFMRCLAVDVAITQALRSEPSKKEAVSSAYIACLRSIAEDMPQGVGVAFLSALGERFDGYVEVIRKFPDEEPFSVASTYFAALCRNPRDMDFLVYGKKMFLSTMNGAAEYLE